MEVVDAEETAEAGEAEKAAEPMDSPERAAYAGEPWVDHTGQRGAVAQGRVRKGRIVNVKSVGYAVGGGVVLLVGVALLVLPGPGLLLVLAGVILLSHAFPRLERFIAPVRDRAMKAAEESVASPFRIFLSGLAGCALIAAGIVWGVVPDLPFGGWPTGASIILSGFMLFALLIYSHRQLTKSRQEAARERAS
jgi:hypothetical protein